MSDAFEDRIRNHLSEQASRVATVPNPDGLMERSAGRHRRRSVAVGGVVLVMTLAAAGVLTGVNLAGGSAVSSSAESVTPPSSPRAGSSVAPGGSASPNLPAIAGQLRYTLLFTRTTSSGVTIRAYAVQGSGGGCNGPEACPPTGTVPGPTPCPENAMCAQPMIVPHTPQTTQPGSSDRGASTAPATVPPDPTPSDPTSGCGQLVVELSTNQAVAAGTALWPSAGPPSADTVEVLGGGSFGSVEGAPTSWVAVWAGAGATSVHLSSPAGAGAVDAMAPISGLAVLAQPGASGLAGTSVVGVDQSGATVGTVPADQTPGGSACASPTPSSSTTTTTPTTSTTTTTTTTVPDPTSTTTEPTPSPSTVVPNTTASVPPRGSP